MKIGVVAPASRIEPALAERVRALAERVYPDRATLYFHPQCYLSDGHFAGNDDARAAAFLELANDAAFDALWIARGGYGSPRILDRVLPHLNGTARKKTYLGYSDAGFLLAALYANGLERIVHGPMPADILREDGEAAVLRALSWLVDGSASALEPGLGKASSAAFNLTILSHLIGTPFLPKLDGHVLLLEEVAEHMYRIDRSFFHIANSPALKGIAGVRLGRCSDIPPNDRDFGQTEEDIARHWCTHAGIPYLGRADIGHDADNKVVPFGLGPRTPPSAIGGGVH
jgi:muramoyltetrapeptide carboxypeptidase